ncbi:MAG: DUF3303 domain-containing protein [Fidelibacterota bacterium]
MLFHITHTHTWESCPAHDPERLKTTFGKVLGSINEIGVELVAVYVDPPAHTVFLIVDADSAEKLEELLDPVLEIGRADIRPVGDGLAVYKRRAGES